MIVKVTAEKFLDAVKQNGYPQTIGSLIEIRDGEVTGACAVGQANLNLGLLKLYGGSYSTDDYVIEDGFKPLAVECPVAKCGGHYSTRSLEHMIIHLNDDHEWTLLGIARVLKKVWL